MRSRSSSEWPRWLLPLFFGAHVLVTAVLIPLLRVQDPLYQAIPWVFGAAFGLSLLPPVGGRLVTGGLAWRISPVALYAVVISLASSVNPRSSAGVSGNVFHPIEYAGLALLAQLLAHPRPAAPLRPARLGAVVLACAAFGALDELHQSFVPRRTAAFEDLLLDTLGALAGTALFVASRWLLGRRSKEVVGG